jgi:hypothetical protein
MSSARARTFAFACRQADPDVIIVDAKISAMMVGAA